MCVGRGNKEVYIRVGGGSGFLLRLLVVFVWINSLCSENLLVETMYHLLLISCLMYVCMCLVVM